MKTFILGLDGATFDQLNPLMSEGYLPTIKKLCDNFTHGPLETIFPPVTAPAWLSIATGLNPGKTGVFDYINRISLDNEDLRPISSYAYTNKSLWNYLNQSGYEVGLFNYPTLSPPPHINGFIVSGMGAQQNTSLCYPNDLNDTITSIAANYETRLNLRNRNYKKNIGIFFNDLNRIIQKQKKVLFYLIKNRSWDFFFSVFSFTDWMQHVLWKDIDKSHLLYDQNSSPSIHLQYKLLWKKIDQIIEEILSILPNNVNFIIVSDHGSGPLDSVFYPNSWLHNNGWLKRKSSSFFKSFILDTCTALSESYDNKYTTKVIYLINKLFLRINSSTDLIDMTKSLAYSPEHNTMFGCINLTTKGKENKEFKNILIRELHKLPEVHDEIKSVRVILPDDIYSGPYTNLSPDIFFVINEYQSTVEIPFAKKIFQQFPSIELRTGSHRSNGVFIASGKLFKHSVINPSILDIAPTILALYDIAIPENMDGKVLKNCIKPEYLQSMKIRIGKPLDNTTPDTKDNTDLEETKNLLKSLGYM